MCLGASFLTYAVPGDGLVHRLHMGLYSLYIMNQGPYHYIDYVLGASFLTYTVPGAIPVHRLHMGVYSLYIMNQGAHPYIGYV